MIEKLGNLGGNAEDIEWMKGEKRKNEDMVAWLGCKLKFDKRNVSHKLVRTSVLFVLRLRVCSFAKSGGFLLKIPKFAPENFEQ